MYNKLTGEQKLAEKLVNYSCKVQKGEKVLITYSDTPNEKDGTYSDIFRCMRYAGATTMDIPKSAFSIKAVPNAKTTIPKKYANSQ
jgi:hypothetical protein